ncbi:ATP-dependent Clp protease, protease subunit [Nocardiopsis flavescens]|uniref:ATP-dependent Clp protease proteolytic subunit n=2 Tax=Nocardiopsis flavescens TaxID=758803 RepID=A0A1M6NX96_9ACTN|nr:ATP-dependent Clp protease proteolytic subunit [Nocardiopsis flavescens]SHK00377.1 ATP-dependent Clp protease, protease subunit [Nocardiopsis flavescens]
MPMTRTSVTASHEAEGGAFDDQLAARLLRSRIVLLGTQVDEDSANRVCAQILLLADEDPHRDITLAVNSPGGVVSAGLAIYDTMNFVPNDVSTLVMGFAASMGQFLACTGAPGKRYSLPHARIMMHQPSGGLGGTAADIAIQAENLTHTKRTMVRLIALHTGQSEETVARDQHRDAWFTAEEAREYGFVDRVVTSLSEINGTGIRLGAGAPGFVRGGAEGVR